MQAVQKTNTDFGIDITDIPTPVIKPGEVLIKVEAASICGSDLHIYRGEPGYEWMSLPLVLGHEFAGTVVEQYNSIELLGRPVVVNPYVPCGQCWACTSGRQNLCCGEGNAIDKIPPVSLKYGFRSNGGMAEYVAVPVENVLTIQEGIQFTTACIAESVAVGVHAYDLASVKVGDSVVIFGPGPLGLSLVSLLSNLELSKLIVVGMSSDKSRLQLAKELGATDILCFDEEPVHKSILEITCGMGAGTIFDTSGSPKAFELGVGLVRKGGEIILVGIATSPGNFPLQQIVRGEVKVQGCYGTTASVIKRSLSLILNQQQQFKKLVTSVYPLDRAKEAFSAANGKNNIKVVLQPA